MTNEQLKCVVSGSFKFKPEIDLAIEELQDYGVLVLAPEKGWLYIAPTMNFVKQEFRPLPKEKGMTLKQIEDSFLKNLLNSDFLYVVDPDGYIGSSSCLEIGFAMANFLPIYSKYQINLDPVNDPTWPKRINQFISVKTIPEIVLELTRESL